MMERMRINLSTITEPRPIIFRLFHYNIGITPSFSREEVRKFPQFLENIIVHELNLLKKWGTHQGLAGLGLSSAERLRRESSTLSSIRPELMAEGRPKGSPEREGKDLKLEGVVNGKK